MFNLNNEALAKKVFNEQNKYNFPGLTQECKEISKELTIEIELEDIDIGVIPFKKLIKRKIKRQQINFQKAKNWFALF